jgi:predicted enzyme related to lactoylglutathione lyase
LADYPIPPAGQVGWIDLTVPNADAVRDFYADVIGWDISPVPMGEYNDYCMVPQGGDKPIAGVCHARGENASMPPVWMIYIMVADLDESVRRCHERGGKVRVPERKIPGSGRFVVIEDPAGAIAGLFQAE